MKHLSLKSLIIIARICTGVFIACLLAMVLFSFTISKVPFDFLSQLGISKSEADQKITSSIMGGYLNYYGVHNAKSIAIGNREAVVNDLLAYTKQQVNSAAFIKEYNALKNGQKPQMNKVQSPEEMRSELVASYKKAVADNEKVLNTSDASLKAIFENGLKESKKALAEAEDPKNENIAVYAKNYPSIVKMNADIYKQQLSEWEAKYPANHLMFVKKRLQHFIIETESIDYTAELTERNGKQYFVNNAYESKNKNWKLAFRAGKEVILPARKFVQQWINEINKFTAHNG